MPSERKIWFTFERKQTFLHYFSVDNLLLVFTISYTLSQNEGLTLRLVEEMPVFKAESREEMLIRCQQLNRTFTALIHKSVGLLTQKTNYSSTP